MLEDEEDIMSQSLLEKAGLVRPRRDEKGNPIPPANLDAILGEEDEDEE
jgi:hypothetical protein